MNKNAICLLVSACLIGCLISCQKSEPTAVNESHDTPVSANESETTNVLEVVQKYVIEPREIATSIAWNNPIPYGIKTLQAEKIEGFGSQDFFNYRASYPCFQSLPNKEVQEKVNQLIQNYVNEEFTEFWSRVAIVSESPEKYVIGINVYWGSYDIIFINQNYCSILFHRYGYRWTESYPMNINLKTGELIQNTDFFVEGYDFYPFMREYCLVDLAKQWEEQYGEYRYMEDRLEHPFNFCFSPTGIYAYFNEFFSHATGDFIVTIPYSVFQGNCVFQNPEAIYAKFNCQPGWNSIQGNGFFVKYPEMRSIDGEVVNTEFIPARGYPSEFTLTVPTEKYGTVVFHVKVEKVEEMESPPTPLETGEFLQIDSKKFERKLVENLPEDSSSQQMYSEKYAFQNCDEESCCQVSITLEGTAETMEEWISNKQHLYYLVNQILSSMEF